MPFLSRNGDICILLQIYSDILIKNLKSTILDSLGANVISLGAYIIRIVFLNKGGLSSDFSSYISISVVIAET